MRGGMLDTTTVLVGAFFLLVCFCLRVTAEESDTLVLSDDGTTSYRIVVAKEAHAGELYAAKELAHFLGEMTGAAFPVVTDDEAPIRDELVVGATRRMTFDELPQDLRPEAFEGFAIVRKGAKLFFLGKITRGTLYAVYDFLDMDLGVRFFSPDLTYVPKHDVLTVDMESRKYNPPLEWRCINIFEDMDWGARNRLNGIWTLGVKEGMLGGVRIVGYPWHSFDALVPVSEYFDKHPEYFSEVNGKRISLNTQLCLTNPDVLNIVIEKLRENVREFMSRPGVRPDMLYIVSVTQNDWPTNYCQCDRCSAVDAEEGGPSGTMIRFVNQVAEALEPEFPNVLVHTFAYQYTMAPPKKTKPRKNVAMFVVPGAIGFIQHMPFDHPCNAEALQTLKSWSAISERIHVWLYGTWSRPYVQAPGAILNADNVMRTLVACGVRGVYSQACQTKDAALLDLRKYLWAQLMWRPEQDARQIVEEFCTHYYGPAAQKVLELIDLVDHAFVDATEQAFRLHYDPSDPERLPGDVHEIVEVAGQERRQSYAFCEMEDRILVEAERLADTPERKLRVATLRLGPWYHMVDYYLGRVGKVMDLPILWKFRLDPDNVGLQEKWYALDSYVDWADIRTDDFWTKQGYDYYGAAWYAVSVDYPETAPTENLSLYFGAVDGYADIYLDGEKIAEQKEPPMMMWDKPFFRALPAQLSPGRHLMTLRVEKENYAAGIWKPVSIVDKNEEVPPRIREAAQRFIDVTTQLDMSHFSEYYGPRRAQFEKNIYPQFQALLERGKFKPSSQRVVPGTIRYALGLRAVSSEPERGRIGVKDAEATDGWCMQQTPDPQYFWITIAAEWPIKEYLKEAQEQNRRFKLRARMKVKKKGKKGDAILWGYYGAARNWAAGAIDAENIPAAQVEDEQWKVFEFPRPLRYEEHPHIHAFARPAYNPDNIEWFRFDWFELVPMTGD